MFSTRKKEEKKKNLPRQEAWDNLTHTFSTGSKTLSVPPHSYYQKYNFQQIQLRLI